MNTFLIVIVLTLSPSGTVVKTTTEMPVKSLSACKTLQQEIMKQEVQPNKSIASVICKTPTNDTSHLTFM